MDERMLRDVITRYEMASFTVNKRLNALIRELMPGELTVDQYGILRYMLGRGACTSSELSDIFCVGKSSITAIINRLFDKKLIRRMPDEKDRRVTYLELTEAGKQLSVDIDSKMQQLLAKYMQHFDKEEAEAFICTYEKLAKVLAEGE